MGGEESIDEEVREGVEFGEDVLWSGSFESSSDEDSTGYIGRNWKFLNREEGGEDGGACDCDSSSTGISGRNRSRELAFDEDGGCGDLNGLGIGFGVGKFGGGGSYNGSRATGTFFSKVGNLGSKPDVLFVEERGTESLSS